MQQGRPGEHLPADDPRAADRRCWPAPASGRAHSVVFGGFSPDALADRINDAEAKVLITADGGWRRGAAVPLKANADVAVAASPDHRARRRGAAHRHRRPHGAPVATSGTTSSMAAADADLPGRAGRQRAPALPALHLGHHGQAQGHHAHDRRLPHAGGLHPQVRVRPPPRHRRVLVRGRHRLGHRPQLHRLRPAGQRRHQRDVRGHARLPGQGPVVGDHREVRGHHPLHGADGHPDVHEVGDRGAGEARPVEPAAARARWASRSTPRRGCGTRSTSAAAAAPSSTRGGRPRPAPS